MKYEFMIPGKRKTIKKKIWLADLTYTQMQISAELVPYAIGCLSAYAEAHLKLSEPVQLFKYPEKLISALENESPPDIIGFSNYIWNSTLSSTFGSIIKKICPETIVIFGGPNYPVSKIGRESFLKKRKEIDFYITFEGEITLVRLIEALHEFDDNVEKVKNLALPSVHCINKEGSAILPDASPRIKNLSGFPSPYLNGKLDDFFDGKLLPIIQLHRGCPFSCTYCVEGDNHFSKVHSNGLEKVTEEIEYIANKVRSQEKLEGRRDLNIADSNFGMYPDDVRLAEAIGRIKKDSKFPEYINVATGKNNKKRVLETAKQLKGSLRLAGSVQTLDPNVLSNIKRQNISTEALLELAIEATEMDANSYSEVILGLPGETKKSHYDSLSALIEMRFKRVMPYQLMLLPGSEIAFGSVKEKFGMISRYRALPRAFGKFQLGEHPLKSFEIEEICVATNTLNFQDYLDCRKVHLMIGIFYNDSVFSALLKFLKLIDIPIFSWLELLSEAASEGELGKPVSEFMCETKNELWRDKKELAEFLLQPGVIERYIDGEMGYNLMFTYKSKCMGLYADKLQTAAKDTAIQLLRSKGVKGESYFRFLDDAVAFDAARMKDLWSEEPKDIVTKFRYDISGFLNGRNPVEIDPYDMGGSRPFVFVHSREQRETISRMVSLYGNDTAGIARILSKAYVKKFLRSPHPA